MRLPNDDQCIRVITELDGDPELTQWEADFIASNRGRTVFSSAQKEVIARLLEKYEV